MISYLPFWRTLKNKGISTYYLITKKKVITQTTIQRMRNNDAISTRSIDDLCKELECNVVDIMEYIDPEDTKAMEKYIQEYRALRGTEPDLADIVKRNNKDQN